jgi:hypothetical protein
MAIDAFDVIAELDRAPAHQRVDSIARGDGERLIGRAIATHFGSVDAD